jgi:4-aminobutyrate aminotransferase-like enzyme
MADVATQPSAHAIAHDGEDLSNAIRQRIAACEPHGLRTYTPSLVVLARSAGSYHFTPEGRRLADFTSGVLVANLGHNPTAWWARVQQYMGLAGASTTGAFIEALPLTSYNAVTEIQARAAERLVANLQAEPGGRRLEKVLWAASGSEAIQKALWAALKFRPGADMIVATRHGFHGKKGLAGATSGTEQDDDRDPRVRFVSFPLAECRSLTRRQQPIDLAPYEAELAALGSALDGRIACLITEPYLGGGGSFHPQREYLQLLERFCRRHEIIMILDEVQANFGRTGPMYALTQYGVEPDIVVLGKGMANGLPVDAAVGRADVLERLDYGEGSDTWSGHPLGCAAVLATLDCFEQDDVLGQAAELSKVIEAQLLRLEALNPIAAIRGEGTVWGVECAGVGARSAGDVACDIVRACYLGDRQGRAIHLMGPLAGKVLRIAPPLVMPLTEAAEYFDALHDIVAHLYST